MRTLGEVDAVYERFALFQGLGRYFQQAGIPWILETNALLTKEAATDRNAVALKRIARDREQRAYERCDVLVAVSDVLKRDIVSEFQIDANKIVVVPNGVDLSVFDPESCEPVRYSDSFTIGFVGALALWQRLDVLLRSVAKVRARGADVAVTIVGDGPKRDAWQALAKELSLEHAAVFVGRVDPSEVPAYIAGFDLAYAGHSGTSESVYFSPIKIYEYMAMGKPVVATRFDDAELLVEEGATGYRFESGDEEELANILEKAQHLGTEELLALGRRARAEVAKSHTWAHRVRELMDELRRREVIG
jgi:glycosyltransferase involved in cell wall biosynthesis